MRVGLWCVAKILQLNFVFLRMKTREPLLDVGHCLVPKEILQAFHRAIWYWILNKYRLRAVLPDDSPMRNATWRAWIRPTRQLYLEHHAEQEVPFVLRSANLVLQVTDWIKEALGILQPWSLRHSVQLDQSSYGFAELEAS